MTCKLRIKIMDKIDETFDLSNSEYTAQQSQILIQKDIDTLTDTFSAKMIEDGLETKDDKIIYWMSLINYVHEKMQKENKTSNENLVLIFTAVYNLDRIYKCKGFKFSWLF